MNKYSNELINNFPEYLFNQINQKKIAARHSGKDIIDLGYGNPDLPTHDKVVEKLIETAKLKKNHKYSNPMSSNRNKIFGFPMKIHEEQNSQLSATVQ